MIAGSMYYKSIGNKVAVNQENMQKTISTLLYNSILWLYTIIILG